MSGVNRRLGLTAIFHGIPKGQTEIRSFERSMEKAMERQEAARLGRPLTKAERKVARKLGLKIAANTRRKDQERRQAIREERIRAEIDAYEWMACEEDAIALDPERGC